MFRRRTIDAVAVAVMAVLVLVGVGLLLASSPAGALTPAVLERISVAGDGSQANSDSSDSAVSADGRYVVFTSSATNLVAGDTNSASDVFLRDRASHSTTLLSAATDGSPANNASSGAAISDNGEWIAFSSMASNVVDADTNGTWDIFLYQLSTGEKRLVSTAWDGSPGNGESTTPAISADGRYIAFTSWASNLVISDTNATGDVFLVDVAGATIERVSVASDGTEGYGFSRGASLSADGRYVAFVSSAANLVAGDTNDASDIFVRDRLSRTTVRVSVASDGTEATGGSSSPAVSADGRYIAFSSEASNLVAGDSNAQSDVFVHDRITGETRRVSVSSAGAEANAGSYCYDISADGDYVLFASDANNLVVPGDTNAYRDVFVHRISTGETWLISVNEAGEAGNSYSDVPDCSPDGRWIVFRSLASNLVPGDTNASWDIYWRDFVSLFPPEDTPTPSATPTGTDTATATPTATHTPSATPTATPTDTPAATPTATASSTPTATFTASPTPTWTRFPTNTPTSTRTPTPTWAFSPTPTPTPFPTRTPTATATPGPVHPSLEWVNFFGEVSLLDGAPAPVGSVLDAYDPAGYRCGTYRITVRGHYGPMPVYRDDPTTPEHDGALPGDTIRFVVDGQPAFALGPDDPIWTAWGDIWEVHLRQTRSVHQPLELGDGWNLVGFNVEPANADILEVLDGVSGTLGTVQTMACGRGALAYYPDLPPRLNSLQSFDPNLGYWVRMDGNGGWHVSGVQIPPDMPISLCRGYNLVSYFPAVSLPVETALASIAGQYRFVAGFDPILGAQTYYPSLPPSLNTLRELKPGRGYWIYMESAGVLRYPLP